MKTNVSLSTMREEVVATRLVEVITLQMSRPEAEALVSILVRTGGHPENTARGYADTVLEALREAGFNSTSKMSGSINFLPQED